MSELVLLAEMASADVPSNVGAMPWPPEPFRDRSLSGVDSPMCCVVVTSSEDRESLVGPHHLLVRPMGILAPESIMDWEEQYGVS